ncbi:MAG: spermidine/putrescine ABC transporter substrate-binding protein [Ruminococcus sp.]|nr:spermidine/putrescine ABC transporter substrate-binding protein [Ruminococcus sp.]
MKRIFCAILALLMLSGLAALFASCGSSYDGEINVYNWGEYFADGSDGTVDIIAKFEDEFNIKVNLTTYETNEELYNLIKSSNSKYDVIFPSDYMVEKLKNEDLIQKLDLSKIPNQKLIMDRFKNMDYDKGNNYSIPYSWNVTGLVYNKTMVKGKPDSWATLWDKNLSGSLLMFNNSRDAYAIAMQMCGISPENFTKADVDKATEKLKEQKPLLKKYAMDQTFTEMENSQSAAAPYYAGDIYTMMTNNEDLVGVLPKEGSNLFVDNMCIPKSASNVDAAHKFINFMTTAENSAANMDYITYASPVEGAKDLIDEDIAGSTLVYPTDDYLDKCYTFRNVDEDVYSYMQEQFVKVMS